MIQVNRQCTSNQMRAGATIASVQVLFLGWDRKKFKTPILRFRMLSKIAHHLYRRFLHSTSRWRKKGVAFAAQWPKSPSDPPQASVSPCPSELEAFFDARVEGLGVWKWRHYFDIYHRHFNPLRHRDNLVLLEIGIYSGGSIDMWRNYFGPSATIYGVDIESACRTYESPGTHILIGDQADPAFWRRVLADGTLPAPDIVIDDGGHTPEQQRVTMEELLPRMPPGGVYICEDIHGMDNDFAAFVYGLVESLNGMYGARQDLINPKRRTIVPTNGVQRSIHSVHLYPFVAVVEKRQAPLLELVSSKHGSQWEPFLS